MNKAENQNTKQYTDTNIVKIAGNIAQAPKMMKSPNGKPFTIFDIANDSGGKYPSYITVHAYNDVAKDAVNAGKGTFVYISNGQLQSFRKQIDGAKYKVTVTYVNAWKMKAYPKKSSNNSAKQPNNK